MCAVYKTNFMYYLINNQVSKKNILEYLTIDNISKLTNK